MKDLEVYNFTNGDQYVQLDKIILNGIEYVLISRIDDNEDISIRKVVNREDGEVLGYLDDEEFDRVSKLFYEKNKVG